MSNTSFEMYHLLLYIFLKKKAIQHVAKTKPSPR